MNNRVHERLKLKGRVRIQFPDIRTSPVEHAIRMLVRDFEAVLGAKPELVTGNEKAWESKLCT